MFWCFVDTHDHVSIAEARIDLDLKRARLDSIHCCGTDLCEHAWAGLLPISRDDGKARLNAPNPAETYNQMSCLIDGERCGR